MKNKEKLVHDVLSQKHLIHNNDNSTYILPQDTETNKVAAEYMLYSEMK